ncbi:leucine-rich repeat and calponin domain-containing protein, partial [Elysia marginata]
MAASYGSGLQSPPHIGRPVDRVFEEAQFTGEIFLNGRKLRDYPKICSKYDLSDTTHVDVSRNRLTDIPVEFCDYLHVERINCYHNVIRSIPDAISQLQTLTHINLSRNQLTVLTPALCMLGALEVLSASNNKLVSLPEEIGRLESLMDLDVSCNEISHLPLQIGDLSSLRCLNLRRNFLVELPIEISRLQLCRLDFSSNRIEKIPTVFRKMETLEQFILDHNPLSSPPAYICTKGRQHIMKFLHIEAIKEDRKRGIMINSDSDMKRFVRKSLPPQQSSDEMRNMLGAPESKWKRHTVLSNDSGYNSTGDLPERNGWHSGEPHLAAEDPNNINNSRMSTSHPYYRNPPANQNSQQNMQSNLYQQHPHKSSPHKHGSSVNIQPSSSECGPGLHQRLGPTSQHAFDRHNSDPVRNEQPSPRLPQEMHPPLFNYQQQQQQQQQANQRKATSIPVSVTPRHRDRAPSPSHSIQSAHSSHSSDIPTPTINSPRSPSGGFFQPVPSQAVPLHSRQNSNTSVSSDELKRQKAEYDRKKRQAEQIRVQQEEEEEREKEARRKAALKLQEEQRLLMERQEEQKRQEERLRRQQEEERERALEEERKRREEEEAAAVRKREEELQRLQEAVRIQAEEENNKVIMRNAPKPTESKGPAEKNKLSNNSHNIHTHRLQQNNQQQSYLQQQQARPQQAPPPPPPSRLPQPPSSLPLHGSSLAYPTRSPGGSVTSPSPSPSSRLSHWQPQQQQQNNRHHSQQHHHHHHQQKHDDYILSENDY